jgi:transposase-like protein
VQHGDAEADVLAYMNFPAQHRAKLHSTNSLERVLLHSCVIAWAG